MFLRRDGKLVKIDKPDSANATVHRDLLLLELRDDWTVGGKTYPAGALLAADFEGFLKGERRFDVLFEPTDAQVARRLQPDPATTSCSTSSTTCATASTS